MEKKANTNYEIHELLSRRWSPRAFLDKEIEQEKLLTLFEAARWSASCANEQPWRFIVGVKGHGQTYQKIWETLDEGNQVWCKLAPVLLLLVTKKTFERNGKPNAWAEYDLGQAAAHLSIQATAVGLHVHQMAGFNADRARVAFSVPDDFEVKTAMAIGYIGEPDLLPDHLKKRELAERSRKELRGMVFSESWSKVSFILD